MNVSWEGGGMLAAGGSACGCGEILPVSENGMQLAICRDDFAAFDEFDLIADSVGGGC
jgi:hypothetical protein